MSRFVRNIPTRVAVRPAELAGMPTHVQVPTRARRARRTAHSPSVGPRDAVARLIHATNAPGQAKGHGHAAQAVFVLAVLRRSTGQTAPPAMARDRLKRCTPRRARRTPGSSPDTNTARKASRRRARQRDAATLGIVVTTDALDAPALDALKAEWPRSQP